MIARFPIDLWIFNEPFGVKQITRLEDRIDQELKKSAIAAIGPQTKEALEEEGITVNIMAKDLTIPSLIEIITDYYDNQEKSNLV